MKEDLLNTILAKVIHLEYQLEGMVTKDEHTEATDRIMTQIDGFVTHYQTLDQETIMTGSRMDRLEERVSVVEQKLLA